MSATTIATISTEQLAQRFNDDVGVHARPFDRSSRIGESSGMGVPLEPTGDELRRLLAAAVDYVAGVLARMPDTPASDLDDVPGFLADEALHGAPPAAGSPLDESNQDAPPSVERSAPPRLSPDSLFQAATIF